MDGLTLLRRAYDAGLRVEAAGDKLLIRGPKRAESVVQLLAEHKMEVLAALKTPTEDEFGDADLWSGRFASQIAAWFQGNRGWQEAQRLAWGEVLNEWHRRHGRRWPTWQCAGCGGLIGGMPALNLPDGNRVHQDPLDCTITFGTHWRGAAHAALD
jgi:hypothetical protein